VWWCGNGGRQQVVGSRRCKGSSQGKEGAVAVDGKQHRHIETSIRLEVAFAPPLSSSLMLLSVALAVAAAKLYNQGGGEERLQSSPTSPLLPCFPCRHCYCCWRPSTMRWAWPCTAAEVVSTLGCHGRTRGVSSHCPRPVVVVVLPPPMSSSPSSSLSSLLAIHPRPQMLFKASNDARASPDLC
jgi:hypothetical protein